MFRVYEHVADDYVDAMIDVLASFMFYPGVVSWHAERSLDDRKGRVIVQDATFVDRAAFDAYRADKAHADMGAQMAEISDWWVGDYETA